MPYIDLTMPINERTPVFPGDPPHKIVQLTTVKDEGWNKKGLTITSHFSTHIDAPSHRFAHGKTLSDFPLEKFIGDCVVLSLAKPDLSLIKKNDIVFIFSGVTEKLYRKDFFENNPVISEELAQKLVAKKVKIVGIDAPSPDTDPYPIHSILLPHDILIVENLMHLRKLVGKRFECFILPLNIENGDGAPCRVIAKI